MGILSKISAMLITLIRRYNDILLKYPLRTSMISAGIIRGQGDVLAQVLLERHLVKNEGSEVPPVDWERTLKIAIQGFLIGGPLGLAWYWYVNPWYLKHLIPRMFPGFTKNFTNAKRVIASAATDLLGGIWIKAPIMVFTVALIQTYGDVKASWEGLKNRLWPTMIVAWSYGPFYKILLYGCVPLFFRGIASSLMAAFTSALFSYVQHNY